MSMCSLIFDFTYLCCNMVVTVTWKNIMSLLFAEEYGGQFQFFLFLYFCEGANWMVAYYVFVTLLNSWIEFG